MGDELKKVIQEILAQSAEEAFPYKNGTASTNAPEQASTLTKETLDEAMRLLQRDCPFKRFMEKHGRSPDDGFVMVVPLWFFRNLLKEGFSIPPFVTGSPYAEEVVICNFGEIYSSLRDVRIKLNEDNT